jgi:hypothetical protein
MQAATMALIPQATHVGRHHDYSADDVCAIYAFLTAGTGIPAILRFTEPRKFQLVK